MKKRGLSAVLALCMAASCLLTPTFASGRMSNFRNVNTYRSGQFIDVSSGAWYADEVQAAYQLGLMKGTRQNRFSPGGNITLAEAVTMAARIHCIYHNGSENFQQSGPAWYTIYVNYAKNTGILTRDFPNYNAAATRAQFVSLFARSLPASELGAINTIQDNEIPDVRPSHANAPEIYLLYRAGVLTGANGTLDFHPSSSIQRSEAATIIMRMALPDRRIKFTQDTDYTWQGDSSLDFTTQLTDGRSFTLSEQAGKVVLVNFWATWCGPCVREMPDLMDLYNEYVGGGEVEIVLINCGESTRTVQAFLARQDYTFPVGCDTTQAISSAYGITAIPRTVIFGRDGTVAEDFVGSQSYNTFKSAIERAQEG